jgi:hypothetical protein
MADLSLVSLARDKDEFGEAQNWQKLSWSKSVAKDLIGRG